MASLFSDFLTALKVRHTEDYSDSRFKQMPFQSMFGLSNLLKEYGVGSVGIKVSPEAKAEALCKMTAPFLLDTAEGFLIVTDVAGGKVSYMSQHKAFTAKAESVARAWNGVAMLASPTSDSVEPEYGRHRVAELSKGVKLVALCALAVVLMVAAMWLTGLYAHWSAWLLLAADCAGIVFSWMLVEKSLGIRTKAADAVCSALEEGGCDDIAQSEASSFFGIVKWSEVGLAYFSVSLASMLLFPQTLPALAAINILCLPYTVWSITYQRFVAKTWCTLCVCVQATLWILFTAYHTGGWTRHIFPLGADFWILGCVYGAVLLGINRLDEAAAKYIGKNR